MSNIDRPRHAQSAWLSCGASIETAGANVELGCGFQGFGLRTALHPFLEVYTKKILTAGWLESLERLCMAQRCRAHLEIRHAHTHTHVKGVDSEDVQAHLCGLTQGWEAESAWAALV